MGSDYMLTKYSFEKPHNIQMDWEDWFHKEQQCLSEGLTWYADGSKTDNGSGAGIHGKIQRHNIYVSIGKYTTIFQAQYAIGACVQENLRRGYLGKCIHILSDSQAALKALIQHQTRSQVVWECKQNLILLAKCNKVTLVWVPGHRGIAGNEKVDAMAREGSANTFTGPEPVFGITKATSHRSISGWMKLQHQIHWTNMANHR
jgi:ribonuclease HI